MNVHTTILDTLSNWKNNLSNIKSEDVKSSIYQITTKAGKIGVLTLFGSAMIPMIYRPIKPLIRRGITNIKEGEQAKAEGNHAKALRDRVKALIDFSLATTWATALTGGGIYCTYRIFTNLGYRSDNSNNSTTNDGNCEHKAYSYDEIDKQIDEIQPNTSKKSQN